ncbi:MAG: hypothetical protein ACRENG_30200, partial [bacterium]
MLKRVYVVASLIILALANSNLRGEIKVQILPNEIAPQRVVLENDSLSVKITLGRGVYFASFLDKINGVEFIDASNPAPVVNIYNNWHLLQIG